MTQQTSPEAVARIFDAELRDEEEPFRPRYNLAPTDPVTVVLQREDGRSVERHRWGLIPAWAGTAGQGARMINARAETIASSPAFRVAFRQRRCIVPADGFYEWRRAGGRAVPFYLHPPDGGLLAIAGLWSTWKDPGTGLWLPSAAVVTTAANVRVGQIHDRMPVLLPHDAWSAWLDPVERDDAFLRSLLVPAVDEALAIRAVSPLVNSVRNDGPELIAPVDLATQMPLFGSGDADRGRNVDPSG
jgi:putative SOS response-associated peptidase YedK